MIKTLEDVHAMAARLRGEGGDPKLREIAEMLQVLAERVQYLEGHYRQMVQGGQRAQDHAQRFLNRHSTDSGGAEPAS